MTSCLRSWTCRAALLLAGGLLVAACSSSASSSPRTTPVVPVAGVDCSAVAAQFAMITKAEAGMGNNSAMTPRLYAKKVAQVAAATVWLADHATGVPAVYRSYWRNQTVALSNQITVAASHGTSTDELLQYSGTATSHALVADNHRVVAWYEAQCPRLTSG
jgi:hypothetical protein